MVSSTRVAFAFLLALSVAVMLFVFKVQSAGGASLDQPSLRAAAPVVPPNLEELIAKRVQEQLQALQLPSRSERRGVDIVIVHHCEELDWLKELRPETRIQVRLFIYDKPGDECKATDKSTLPADLTVIQEILPNVAKDGHGQVYHIARHYDDLATHTMFLQAGYHSTIQPEPDRNLTGWETQAEAVNDITMRLTDDIKFMPVTSYHKVKGPRLHTDAEDDTDEGDYAKHHADTFSTGWSDMYNRAKEMYAMMFGGTPCDAKQQYFTAGMQYVVHRDNLRRRPLTFWKKMLSGLAECDEHYGYAMERVTSAIFDGPEKIVDPLKWKTLSFCRTGDADTVKWEHFTTPLKRFESAEEWRKEWGCEPLSKRIVAIQEKLKKEGKKPLE